MTPTLSKRRKEEISQEASKHGDRNWQFFGTARHAYALGAAEWALKLEACEAKLEKAKKALQEIKADASDYTLSHQYLCCRNESDSLQIAEEALVELEKE